MHSNVSFCDEISMQSSYSFQHLRFLNWISSLNKMPISTELNRNYWILHSIIFDSMIKSCYVHVSISVEQWQRKEAFFIIIHCIVRILMNLKIKVSEVESVCDHSRNEERAQFTVTSHHQILYTSFVNKFQILVIRL